jgi:ankyrin repeat protein
MAEYEPQLRAAAQRGNVSLMEQLLKQKKLNIDARDGLGNTALHYSAHHDHPSTLVMLLEAGAQVNVQNNAGETPLHKAVAKGSIPCIKALVEHGGDPKIESRDRKTPQRMAKSAEAKALLKNVVLVSDPKIDLDMIADADDKDE